MAKSVFIILLVCGWNCIVCAQQNCDLAAKSSPLLLNLKLGMSASEAQNLFGKDLKIKVKKNGERTVFQNYIKNPAPNSLKGVRAIYLRFYDKKLYQVEIFYEQQAHLKTLEKITGALAVQFDFPPGQWEINNGLAKTHCNNLSLIADNVLNPRIQLTDNAIYAEVLETRKKN